MPKSNHPTPTSPAEVLLAPYRLNKTLTLSNRVVMAPMTRSMADDDLTPTPEMAAYYARRAAAGLIITEGTIIRPDGQGYPHTPGIYTPEQVRGWRRVTDGVHARDGRIFVQLWHVGRVSHPVYLDGRLPLAPSAVPLSGRLSRRKDLEYGTPRGLETAEISELVEAFGRAAANARKAGFDGVEIHGANGYLVDQFLHHHTNRRRDDYGGTPENMARFALEVVDAAAGEMGAERVGLRLSPGAYHYMEGDSRDVPVFRYLLRELEQRAIAYVHLGIFDDSSHFDYLDGSAGRFLWSNYGGTFIGCGSYTPESAARGIIEDEFDLIAFGRSFIANPDLIEKIRAGESLKAYDKSMLKELY